MPNAGKIKTSSKEDLLQLDPAFSHAVSLALTYSGLQDVLQTDVGFSELLVESAACMARTERLDGAKRVLAVAHRTLGKLDAPVSTLRRQAATMQRFFDDWGV